MCHFMNILLKRTYLILILSIGFNSCINSVKNNEYILLEEKLNGEYHTIFIDTSKNSKYYDQIANFSFNNFDQESYNKTVQSCHLRQDFVLRKFEIKGSTTARELICS